MPLSDDDADKLCRGRIVYLSDLLDSSSTHRAGPHYAIMLDDTARIQATGRSRVVVISTNDQIDKSYLVPVPKHSGLAGNIVCSWYPIIDEPQIEQIWNKNLPPLTDADLVPILEMIVRHRTESRGRR